MQEIEPQRRRDAEEDKQLTTDNRPQTTALEYLEKAVSYYHKSLVKNEKAIAYLQSRGITPEAVGSFAWAMLTAHCAGV
ncbi:MAG: hypothetical protein IPG58_06820 [Acidobacteria bacterium]|nr:hypothetical protein [Acidobacteriota bacterium]